MTRYHIAIAECSHQIGQGTLCLKDEAPAHVDLLDAHVFTMGASKSRCKVFVWSDASIIHLGQALYRSVQSMFESGYTCRPDGKLFF